jgi:hypothetical protein
VHYSSDKAQPFSGVLAKDPKHRLRDIGDVMPLLDAVPEVTPMRRPWPWVVAAVLTVALAVLAFTHFRETPPRALVLRYTIVAADSTSLVHSLAISRTDAMSQSRRR